LEKATIKDDALADRFFRQAADLDPSFADAYCGPLETLHRPAVVFATRGTPAGPVSKERGRTP
jgi:hypothetical protein